MQTDMLTCVYVHTTFWHTHAHVYTHRCTEAHTYTYTQAYNQINAHLAGHIATEMTVLSALESTHTDTGPCTLTHAPGLRWGEMGL